MILAIDFDDTIHDTNSVPTGKRMGLPLKGARDKMIGLSKKHFLIIHTVRAAGPNATEAVIDWLKFFDIPFSSVTNIKPNADYFIDNKNIAFTNWDQPEIEALL